MASKGIVGVDIGGTNIKAALVAGRKISRRAKTATLAHCRVEESIGQIISIIQPLHKEARGIGIGIAGIIDSKKGVVKYSPNLTGWENIPLAKILRAEFDRQVYILNDVNAICLGEWKYGAGRGYNNIFLFTLGTGVGGAAICEGKLLFGAHGFAGEFGHTTIHLKGPQCVCGHYGHVERYAGARHIVARAQRKIAKQKSSLHKYDVLTPQVIARAAKQGDRVAREVFSEVGYYIGIGVANLLALFDPEIVIISGGIARAGRVLFTPIRQTVQQETLGSKHRHCKIVPALLGDDAGILGAALFAELTEKNPSI
jgi:glucokinase